MGGRDLADFVAMGGYALYVWGSFSMCGAAALWEAVLLLHRRRRAIEDLRDDLARRAAMRRTSDGA